MRREKGLMIKLHLLTWLVHHGYSIREIRGCRHIVVENGWRFDLLGQDLRDRSGLIYPYDRNDPFADRIPSSMSFPQLMSTIKERAS